MAPEAAKMARPPLSEYSQEELRARASELRDKARTARLEADIHALRTLAERFDSLAKRCSNRGELAPPARRKATASVIAGIANKPKSLANGSPSGPGPHYPPCPGMPEGEDFAKAWRLACQYVSAHYVLPETMHHPAVVSQCYSLACKILAYGLISEQTQSRADEALRATTKVARAFDASHHRAIVVDDVADVLVSVGAFLVNAGFTVRKAANGDEALRLIMSDPSIDLLVTDFAMPGLNGVDLIGQAIQVRPSMKALVITGYPNADGLTELPTGTTVLAKPFRRDALLAAVKALFEESGAMQEQAAAQPEAAFATVQGRSSLQG
jgi:CheY-like chemotaxis protein